MKKVLSIIVVMAMLFSLASCTASDSSSSNSDGDKEPAQTQSSDDSGKETNNDSDKIIIGGLAPLTGEVSQYGKAVVNGINLAVEDINAKGGVLGKEIVYICEDEQGDPTQAVNAYKMLSQKEDIVALLGDVTTKPTIAVAQLAAADGIPMITATATGEEVTLAGDNIFRACFIDPYQGELMANYAFEKLDAKTAAVLYDTGDDYSGGIATAFKEASEGLGVEITNYEGYAPGIDDFNTQLTKIQQSNPDVIMLPCYYEDATKIITQARELGIETVFLGPDGFDGVLNQVPPSKVDVLNNVFYCSQYSRQSESEDLQNFLKRYNDTYKVEENMFSVLGYDSMMVLADAIERAGSTDPEKIIDALNSTNYAGLTGTTTFDENRNPKREAYITTFEKGESKVVETYVF